MPICKYVLYLVIMMELISFLTPQYTGHSSVVCQPRNQMHLQNIMGDDRVVTAIVVGKEVLI